MSRIQPSAIPTWPTADIYISDRKRGVDEETVQRLVKSIPEMGLLNPITIRFGSADIDGEVETDIAILVAGRQRLEALKRLGHDVAAVNVVDCDEVTAKMSEISENLDRAELTKLERAAQIEEWVALCGAKHGVSAQLEPKPSGRPEGGIRAASRELGLDRNEVTRAIKIAGIAPEAKDAATAAGLDDNQAALLQVADAPTLAKQVEKVFELTAPKVGSTADIQRSKRSEPVRKTRKRSNPKNDGRSEPINLFHNELVSFLADFTERFREWNGSELTMDEHGKIELMQALYLCSDGLSQLAEELAHGPWFAEVHHAESKMRIQDLPTGKILDRVDIPRPKLCEAKVAKLVASIGEIGLLLPIVVRATERFVSGVMTKGVFEVLAGRHRLEACCRLGHETIACKILEEEPAETERQAA